MDHAGNRVRGDRGFETDYATANYRLHVLSAAGTACVDKLIGQLACLRVGETPTRQPAGRRRYCGTLLLKLLSQPLGVGA